MSANEETAGSEPAQIEMNFFDHLEELRKRIILALVGVIIGSLIAGIFRNEIMSGILLRPAVAANLELQNLRPFGQVFLIFKVVLITGVIISFPFILYQLWRFIAPGLYEHERSWARTITFFTSLCFAAGVAFAYFVMVPAMMNFAASSGLKEIKNSIDVNEYFGFMTTTLLGAGLIFELPMITWVLARVGLVTEAFMRKYRRHAIIIILIIAAIATPSPDPVNQLIFALPLYALYEISIIIAKFAQKKSAQTSPESNH
jgi:sec-independent protein translocase protein TatC